MACAMRPGGHTVCAPGPVGSVAETHHPAAALVATPGRGHAGSRHILLVAAVLRGADRDRRADRATLMDAFLVRTLLLLSTVALLSRWNWYPSTHGTPVQATPD